MELSDSGKMSDRKCIHIILNIWCECMKMKMGEHEKFLQNRNNNSVRMEVLNEK